MIQNIQSFIKPIGVSFIVYASFFLIMGIVILVGASIANKIIDKEAQDLSADNRVENNAGFTKAQLKEGMQLATFVMTVALIILAGGIGLLKKKNWGRRIIIAFCIFAAFSSMPSFFQLKDIKLLLFAIFHVVGGICVLVYLTRPNVKICFE